MFVLSNWEKSTHARTHTILAHWCQMCGNAIRNNQFAKKVKIDGKSKIQAMNEQVEKLEDQLTENDKD